MDRLRQYCKERLPVVYQPQELAWADRRLRQELKAIQKYGQGQAFEDAHRSVHRVRDQGGSCRLIGAGCSSLVSYLLGLSEIDPIAHGLLFERFLEANSLRTVQFQFVAYWKTGHIAAEHQPIYDGLSSRAVRIQQATPLEAVPGLVAEEIRRNDRNFDLTSIPPHDEMAYARLRCGMGHSARCVSDCFCIQGSQVCQPSTRVSRCHSRSLRDARRISRPIAGHQCSILCERGLPSLPPRFSCGEEGGSAAVKFVTTLIFVAVQPSNVPMQEKHDERVPLRSFCAIAGRSPWFSPVTAAEGVSSFTWQCCHSSSLRCSCTPVSSNRPAKTSLPNPCRH